MNDDCFNYIEGSRPILISMPHNGTQVPEEIELKMTRSAKKLVDTDWYLDRLYQFAIDNGCYLINPKYSRYVIDLNRPENNQNLYPGQDTTELCPTTQFDKQPVYLTACEPDKVEINRRVEKYWHPYHQKLQLLLSEIKSRFGSALLFEAHSIKSEVPRFFNGKLPDFNFGNYNNQSCSDLLTKKIIDWQPKGYSKVVNGRFKGGYITRAYGEPENNIHSIQLELSQATYMNETNLEFDAIKASQVEPKLAEMFEIFYEFIEV